MLKIKYARTVKIAHKGERNSNLSLRNSLTEVTDHNFVHFYLMTVGTTFPTKRPLIYLQEGLVSPHRSVGRSVGRSVNQLSIHAHNHSVQ